MANLQESFDSSCRLCAEVHDVTIVIFSPEGEAMHMQNKLNRYLQVEVSESDKLPKNICIPCCTKLQLVCEFIDTIHKAQDILLDQSRLLDQIPVKKLVGVNIERVDVIQTNQIPTYFNEDSNVTNMEVSIDPMTILQDSSDGELVIDESVCNNDDNESLFHGVDRANVTIKLINRGDSSCCDTLTITPMVTAEPISEEGTLEEGASILYRCSLCNRGFSCEVALQAHSWTHTEERNPILEHKCPSCELYFEYKNDLINHLKEHRNVNVCNICGRSFKTEVNLQIHMKGHDTPAMAFVCKDCGRSYNSRSNLKTHSITHSNIRPYKCSICKKCFKRNQDLKFHMNQHTGNKPYKCQFCEKSFASSGNCYSHRTRMHPTSLIEKPLPDLNSMTQQTEENFPVPASIRTMNKYQCHLCDHSFMKRDNYMYHLYQHTGEKPFQCSFCTDNFVTRRGLILHHDVKHPDKNRPLALISKNMLLK